MTRPSPEPATTLGRSRSLRDTAFRGSLWSATYRWSSRLVSFGAFVVLSRLLEPEQFGLVALAVAVSGVMSLLVDFGLPRYIVFAPRVDDVFRSTLLWTSLGIGLLMAGIQVAAAPALAAVLGDPAVTPLLRVLALGYPMTALYGAMSAFQKREMRFRLLAVRGGIAVLVSAAVAVLFALAGAGVWALVAQVLAYSAASVVTLWVVVPWRPRALWSADVLRDALRYGRPALGAAVMDVISGNADNVIIGRRLGVDQLGYYSVAYRLVQVILDLLVGVVHSVTSPVLARAKDDRILLAAAYRRAVTQGVLVSAPVVAVMAALMPQLVVLCFGAKWAPVGGVAAVLALSRALLVPVWFDSALYYAIGRVRGEMRLATVHAAMIVLAVTAGSLWGLTGVAVALLVRSLLLLPLRMVLSCRVTGQGVAAVAGAVSRIWLAAACAGAAAWLAAQFVAGDLTAVVCGAVSGGTVFLAAAWMLANGELRYLAGTVRQLRRVHAAPP